MSLASFKNHHAILLDNCPGDPDMLDGFEDAYLGHFDSPEAWAESVFDDMGTREEIDRLLEEKVGDLARYVQLDTGACCTALHREGRSHSHARKQRPGPTQRYRYAGPRRCS